MWFRLSLLLSFAFLSISSAAPTDSVLRAISDLCIGLQGLLPVAGMLMVVVAAVIYAGGQMMGAETRARANVWATAALTGAMIAILIAAVAPPVLKTIYGPDITCIPSGASSP
jgi:hypothetical protein